MHRATRTLFRLNAQSNALHNNTLAASQILFRSISSHHKVNLIPSGNVDGCTTKNRHLTSVFLTARCSRQSLFAFTASQSTPTYILSRCFSVSLSLQQTPESTSTTSPHVIDGDPSNSLPTQDVSSTLNSQPTVLQADSVAVEATVGQPAPSPPSNELVLDFLPEKPTPLVMDNVDITSVVNWVGDPPLETLGLASWWPSGRMQALMEYMHGSMDLPWWVTIVCVTVMLRLLTFPLVVKMQRNVAVMNNFNPKLMAIQAKISDARRRGDSHDVAALSMEMQTIFKENNVSPFSNLIPMLVQLPIFMSMFFGLRGMANLPLESMMSGGILWFKDLTLADPYYGLSILMASTLYLQFKLAADGASLENSGPIARNVMKIIPVILFPVTMNFPSAITFYWFTTNTISIAQAMVVRQEAVRKYLNIPKKIQWDKKDLPGSNKSFREGVRDMIDNTKVQADIFDRRLYDAESFKQAGSGKVKRTYKFDPTKSSRI